MKCLSLFLAATISMSFYAPAETITDLKSWKITGAVEMDAAQPTADGAPSIKVGPKSSGVLKLRDTDGSGKVSLLVYDDGILASPGKKKSVGPRWGLTQADGRVLVVGIMYARFLQEEGSMCLFDIDPKVKGSWAAMKFIGQRGKPGWKKWEFHFDPAAGLKISVDGVPIPAKYFDWNLSQAKGFNGLIFYGDDTVEGAPQTIWIGNASYELGGAMTVAPAPMAAASVAAVPQATPISEEEIARASTGEPAKMAGFVPGRTLADDLKNMRVPLVEGYATQRPRLLFSDKDRDFLKKRAELRPDLWKAVLDNARSVRPVGSEPAPDLIMSGAKYWAVERIESGALAWFVTGENDYRDGVKRWMLAHAKVPVWGTLYRPNLDLAASWYLYHMAIGYDVLWKDMSEEERKVVRDGLIDHARAIYADHDPTNTKDKIRYDQNHTYIPIVALMAASLALVDEVPEAKAWLNRSYAILRRCRYVLGEDGYYHEGSGYWTYALHWHIRGAELVERATGEKMFELPAIRDTWKHALYLSLPGFPGVFDIGDAVWWKGAHMRPEIRVTNSSMLWAIGAANGSSESQAAGDFYATRLAEKEYPASAFLWFDPETKAAVLDDLRPYHYFSDHGIVSWRSSWKPDATCYLFRCGPPLGHRALEKIPQFSDWTMNLGHVHPDIGAFWIYAKGAYLAVGTGFTTRKWTKDHNTLLVDGKGQGDDGSYWNERGIPYQNFDAARIDREFLSDSYGFVSGEFGEVYKSSVPGVKLRRNLLMTKGWLLIIDDMSSDKPHELTWLCHTDGAFQVEGAAFVSRLPKAALAVLPLGDQKLKSQMEPTVVTAGKGPGQETPQERGFQLSLTLSQPAQNARIVNLLVPLGENEKMPTVQSVKTEGRQVAFDLTWPDGKVEHVALDLDWKGTSADTKGPASIQ